MSELSCAAPAHTAARVPSKGEYANGLPQVGFRTEDLIPRKGGNRDDRVLADVSDSPPFAQSERTKEGSALRCMHRAAGYRPDSTASTDLHSGCNMPGTRHLQVPPAVLSASSSAIVFVGPLKPRTCTMTFPIRRASLTMQGMIQMGYIPLETLMQFYIKCIRPL